MHGSTFPAEEPRVREAPEVRATRERATREIEAMLAPLIDPPPVDRSSV